MRLNFYLKNKFGGISMSKEKLDFILEVFPHVQKILPFATEENLEKLFEQAQQRLEVELMEAQFE